MKTLLKATNIVRFFFVGNLGLAYTDSAWSISGFYGLNLASIGMLFLLLTYYSLLYFKKTLKIRITEKQVRLSFGFLKVLAFLVALMPLFITKSGHSISFEVQLNNLPLTFLEIMKIIGIELAIDLSLWIEEKIHKNEGVYLK